MKINKLGAIAFAGLMAAQVQAASNHPVFLLLDNYGGFFKDGDPESDIYVNITFKINDRYTLTPELNNIIYYHKDVVKAGAPSTAVEKHGAYLNHDMLQLTLSDTALGKVGDWKLTAAYQWYLPTNDILQRYGALGILYYRPQLNRSFGPVDLMFRNRFGLYLQRSSFALNDPAHDGNPLYDNLMEFSVSGSPGGNWGLSAYWADRHTYFMNPLHRDFTRWGGRFYQELEVNYTSDWLNKTNFAFVLNQDNRYGTKADGTKYVFKPYVSTATQLVLRISKTFE